MATSRGGSIARDARLRDRCNDRGERRLPSDGVTFAVELKGPPSIARCAFVTQPLQNPFPPRSKPRAAGLEVRRVTSELAPALASFFAALRAGGDERLFHPHPLTAEHAVEIGDFDGGDLYYVLFDGSAVLGYGLLRGWDEGYEVPSLGIAIHPEARGRGLAAPFMHFLHAAAALRGAPRVRLKVYRSNERARALYERLGYAFAPADGDELVGFRDL